MLAWSGYFDNLVLRVNGVPSLIYIVWIDRLWSDHAFITPHCLIVLMLLFLIICYLSDQILNTNSFMKLFAQLTGSLNIIINHEDKRWLKYIQYYGDMLGLFVYLIMKFLGDFLNSA